MNISAKGMSGTIVDRLLTIREVVVVTGLSKSTLYRMQAEGLFPRARKISKGRVAWRASDVENWIEEKH
ncbi:MAG: hypothetical protein RLZ98_3120 [Pseudomonadota bacterium]|jgi:prophage regulatory protein